MKKKADAKAQAQAQAQAQAPIVQHESLPPPKRHRIADFQADASPSSRGHPLLHAPLFDTNPPMPLLDPPADLDLLYSPGDERTVLSCHFADDILLDLHDRAH